MTQIFGTPAGETLLGTEESDYIVGQGGGDVINADAGNDYVLIGDGTDIVDAGDGNDFVDTFDGGDDVIHLGAGDDDVQVLSSGPGVDRVVTVHGEAGDDEFLLNDTNGVTEFRIDGGDGADKIYIQSAKAVTIDAGAGDDIISSNLPITGAITLGGGHDLLWLQSGAWTYADPLRILDFQVSGASADRIDLSSYLANLSLPVVLGNAFAEGYLRLYQDSADALLQVRTNLENPFETLIRFVGVQASSLTQASFSGMDPLGGPSVGLVLTGDADKNTFWGSAFQDHLTGGDGDDYLDGHGGRDVLEGGAGSDTLFSMDDVDDQLFGGEGDDALFYYRAGGTGSDDQVLLDGGAGDDSIDLYTRDHVLNAKIVGGAGNDRITVFENGGARIEAGDGDDQINLGDGDEWVDGGAGFDTLDYTHAHGGVTFDMAIQVAQATDGSGVDVVTGIERLRGSYQADVLSGDGLGNQIAGDQGADVLNGRDGDDQLSGDDGNDELHGGAGADVLVGGAGDDLFDGGADLDLADFHYETTRVTVDLSISAPQDTGFGMDRFTAVENVLGGRAGDILTGGEGVNRLFGEEGDDKLVGGGGDDVLFGGAGADALDGGTGFDTAAFTQSVVVDLGAGAASEGYMQPADTLISIEGVLGSAGDDTLIGQGGANVLAGAGGDDLLRGLAGDDVLNGGDGVDTADFADAAVGLTVDLTLSAAQDTGDGRDTFIAVENLIGSTHDDLLIGDGAANSFAAGDGQDWLITNGGADSLLGGEGHDSLWGGAGDDVIEGGLGDDTLFGAAGSDTASYATATGAVRVDLTILEDQNTGAAGSDTLVSIENIIGSDYADVLIGNAGDNIITGGRTTWVGGGDDPSRFVGDVMTGGGGNDTFVFRTPLEAELLPYDKITDFSRGDRIDLSMVDMDIWTEGRQGLHFGQTAEHKGDVTVYYYGNGASIAIDTNNDEGSDLIIYVSGDFGTLSATDFIF